MANVKISQLPSLSTMTDSAEIPVVSANTTYQITGANLQNYFTGTYGNGMQVRGATSWNTIAGSGT